mmetsp:Transcript_126067/g.402952  ORF Transcript_126067/g.402952 Transcript_126067/m.402952 type:complete len:804 (+) Transcript_126067:203-2614(+)
MHKQKLADSAGLPTTFQRKLIFLLLGSNVIACLMNMICMRAALHVPPASDPVDVASGPERVVLPGSAPEVDLQDLDFYAGPKPLATTPVAAERTCGPCSARIHGALPTTQRHSSAQRAESCTWALREGMRLSGAIDDAPFPLPTDAAKEFCFELGETCKGIACRTKPGEDEERCLLRAGDFVAGPSGGKEDRTHLKDCSAELGQSPGSGKDCDDVDVGNGDLDGDDNDLYSSPAGAGSEAGRRRDLRQAAVVVLAHNREEDLKACLHSLFGQQDAALFKFYVSLDDPQAGASMAESARVVASEHGLDVDIWNVEKRVADESMYNRDVLNWIETYTTAKIAHHYWVAFERAFMEHGYEFAIFVEEDLKFSPDFLALFRSTAWLLEEDPSLWCVSSWNDMGFKVSFSDECRLFRTSYFPGLGFLLPRRAWLRLRDMWPDAPTMGWDYWMRVAFRTEGKECVIPEISRSHHVAEHGSSVNTEKQRKLFRSMALAQLPNTCSTSAEGPPCRQFGDVSYLREATYERLLRAAVAASPQLALDDLMTKANAEVASEKRECLEQHENLGTFESAEACAALVLANPDCAHEFQYPPAEPSWGCRCCKLDKAPGKPHDAWNVYIARRRPPDPGEAQLDKGQLYVVPYVFKDFDKLVGLVGLRPAGTLSAIPKDVRAEHHGVFLGRHLASRAQVLLVDRRSSHGYLLPSDQLRPSEGLAVVPAIGRDMSCSETCQERGMRCDAEQLHFVNNCSLLQQHFDCKFCAHQVGEELPVYVSESSNMNVGQCLVTFISPMKCDPKHAHTQRLCACVPA